MGVGTPPLSASTLNAGPKADPDGLLPNGVPPSKILPPLGTMALGRALVELAIIY